MDQVTARSTVRWASIRLVLVAVLAAPALWADANSPTHHHSTSLDGSSGDSGMGSASKPPPPPPGFGGGSYSPAPPPPPPPPPPVYSPKVIKGTGAGVESKLKALGKPGESKPERQPRTVSGDYYGDGEYAPTPEEVGRRGPRTPNTPVPVDPSNSPASF